MLQAKALAQYSIPVAYLLLSFLIFHYALHTQNQWLRWLFLPPLVCFNILSFTTSKHFSLFPSIFSLWAQSVALNTVHITSLLFIEQWPAPPEYHQRRSRPAAFHVTYQLWANPRLLPKARTSANKIDEEEEALIVFLLLRLSKLPIYYYLYTHLLPSLFGETLIELSPSEVGQLALVTRLTDVTPREVFVRSYVAISWVWESFVFLDGANAVLAVFAVLSGLDRPVDWPPLFGPPIRIGSLRSFWSCFWHRLANRPYKSYARFVAIHVLGFLHGKSFISSTSSLVFNTFVALVVFLLSGVSHAAVSWRLGMRDWLDVKWFLLNFAACLAETVFLSTVRKLAKRAGLARELIAIERSWLGQVAGLTWVFAFFFWSVPLWRFPRLYEALMRAERWAEILSKITIVSPGTTEMS